MNREYSKSDIEPCVNCHSKEIDFHDCGYSSFNVSRITCLNCDYEVDTHGASDTQKMISFWNDEKRRLKQERLKVIRKLQELNMLINENDAEIET